MKVTLTIVNCLDCPFHKNVPSPPTGDSFDQADEDTICTKAKNRKIAVANRFHSQMRKECVVPKWCPLAKRKK